MVTKYILASEKIKTMFNEINKGYKSRAALINLAHSLEREAKSSAPFHIHLGRPSEHRKVI